MMLILYHKGIIGHVDVLCTGLWTAKLTIDDKEVGGHSTPFQMKIDLYVLASYSPLKLSFAR